MKSQEELLEIVNAELSKQDFNIDPKELFEPITYTLSLGGKRIRPVLTLMSCEMFGGSIDKALYPALGLEIFHNFTLIHDDILDNAPLRRGKETVYKKWNSNIAILSGDTMFALAYTYFFKTRQEAVIPILNVFNKTVLDVCRGQQYDMNFETQDNIGLSDYIEMIRLKTAVLLGACVQIGAVIAKANEDAIGKAYTFAEKLGIAFQLKDDLLDLFGDQDLFGKKTGGDILSYKKTYLLLKALALCNNDEKKELHNIFYNSEIEPEEKIAAVKSIYEALNVQLHTEKEIEKYYHEAVSSLDSIAIPASQKEVALSFASKLMKRFF